MKPNTDDIEMMDFTVFYRKYFGAIFNFCYKLLSSNNIDDGKELATDLTEDSLIAVWERYDTYETESQARAYLYKTAKNKVFNKLQKQKRLAKSHKEILYLSSEADEESFNVAVINSDVIAFIMEQVSKLPPQRSHIITMFFKGLNSTQIANQMHIKRKTVLNQKLKGIEVLKRLILLKYG